MTTLQPPPSWEGAGEEGSISACASACVENVPITLGLGKFMSTSTAVAFVRLRTQQVHEDEIVSTVSSKCRMHAAASAGVNAVPAVSFLWTASGLVEIPSCWRVPSDADKSEREASPAWAVQDALS